MSATDTVPGALEPEVDPGHRDGPWLTALLALLLGGLLVFAVVALVVPAELTDPSGLRGKQMAAGTMDGPVSIEVAGRPSVAIERVTIPPGRNGGWHQHRGHVLVTVLQGEATFYDRDDPRCRPRRYAAGDSEIEAPNHPHITRNEGTVPLVLWVVSITPHGQSPTKAVTANPECR